jgi:4-amino-4-deoxy-L-arabinose transferase-like glycosyltransferase
MKLPWIKSDRPLIHSDIASPLIILCGLCLFLFFYRLAETGIMYPSFEPRRMLLAKDMVRNGHWLIPYLLGSPYVAKPPVLPWLISAGHLLAGNPSLWATRAPVALAGLLNVVVTFFFGKRLFNQRVGFFAAVILATSLFYIRRTRMAEEDIVLALFINLSLLTFFLAYYYQAGKRYYLMFYLFVSLACLTKGVSGLIFPLLTIIPYLFLRKDLRAIGKMELLAGAVIFISLALSWYLYAYNQIGLSGAQTIFIKDIWHKILPGESGRSFLQYVVHLPQYVVQLFQHFFPWSVLLPALAIYIGTKKKKTERERSVFLLCLLLANILFFSLLGVKRNEYILPLYPALAILTAQVWNRFLVAKKASLLKNLTVAGILIFSFLAIGGGLFGLVFSLIQYPEDLLWNGLSSAFIVLCGVAVLIFVKHRQYSFFFPVTVLLTMGFVFTFTTHIAPTYLKHTTPHEFCAKVASTIGRDAKLISFRCQDEFIINELDRKIPNIKKEHALDNFLVRKRRMYIIMDGKEFLRLKEKKDLMHEVIFHDHFLKMKRSVALVTNKIQN